MKSLLVSVLVFCGFAICKAQDHFTINLSDGEKPAVMHVFPADTANNNNRAIVLCPGGGYSKLSMKNEGYNWVPYFRSLGMTTVILQYRMPKGNPEIPIGDAAKAMMTVRENAKKWNIDPKQVGIMGFSAGGHLASMITVSNDTLVRPDFSVLFYPVITMSEEFMHRRSHNELLGENASDETNRKYSSEQLVSDHTPPTFIALSNDDRTVHPLNSLRFYEAMVGRNLKVSLHIYPSGRHGWGFRDTFLYHEQMKNEMKRWLETL